MQPRDGTLARSLAKALQGSFTVHACGKSPEYLRNAQAAVAAAVPDGELRVLPGQTHMIKPKVVAPVVTSHLLTEGER